MLNSKHVNKFCLKILTYSFLNLLFKSIAIRNELRSNQNSKFLPDQLTLFYRLIALSRTEKVLSERERERDHQSA